MSFFKKLLGRDFEGLVRRAEELAGSGRLGEAVLAYREALDASRGESAARVEEVRGRLDEVRDQLARQFIAEGRRMTAEGEPASALEAFEAAAEAAVTAEIAAEARALLDGLEAEDARVAFAEAQEMTDDERYEALAGGWEDEQADELEGFGEPFREAFLALHDGRAPEAAEGLGALAGDNDDAVFLHLELGSALYASGRLEEAVAAVKLFLERLDETYGRPDDEPDEDEAEDEDEDEDDGESPGSSARIRAHDMLAQMLVDRGDLDEAEAELRALVELLPDKPGPYVVLGSFLRSRGRAEEALGVLEDGQRFMGEIRPDMRVPREIGLTLAVLDRVDEAIESLRAVVTYQAAQGDFNFDPVAAVPLAELYEKAGEPERAADIYRHLAAGTHAEGHFVYNFRAGRLLSAAGQTALARRHLARAAELAADPEAKAAVAEAVETLGGDAPKS